MYTLRIKRVFRQQGRQVKNIGGRVVVFRDGVAYGVSENVADVARRQHYIESVEFTPREEENVTVEKTPEPEAPVEEEVQEEPIEEPVIEEESRSENGEEEVVEEDLADDEIEVHDNVVADTEETEDGVLSADEIQTLYDSLGTWSAVADHLGITTTTLRKYREETGLL